jgi:two-component system response regulator HupR/HoxA
LVDDDAELLEGMSAVLADRFQVSACTSGEEALQLLDRETFHVVCTDWRMPGMDGLAFFRAVAARKWSSLPCFLLITAHTRELLDQIPYADRRMLGLLRKPFNPEQLIECVSQFAGVAQQTRLSEPLKPGLFSEPE